MSEVVLKWLNSDIGLSRPVQQFEADFANGFLLGELLHKHGLLDDFRQHFVDENSYAAQSANFSHLKAALRGPAGSLGVKLRDEQVREIMGGDRGSSLRLLFQLRKGLERAGASAGRASAARGQEETKAPSMRQPRDAKEEHFFQSRLKPLARTEKRVAYELHTKPYINEQMRQMTLAADNYSRDVQAKWDESQAFRASRLSTMQDSRAAKDSIKAKGQEKWTANVQRKADSIGKDLMFEKQMIRREYQRVDRIREQHQQDCGYRESDDSHGIAWFERNLQRLGIDTSEHAGSSEATIEAANAKELYEKMHEKLPAKAQLQVESAEKMKQIRDVKKASDLARKEREQRQRKVQVEQQATQALVEQQRSEEEVLSWLAKEAAEYRRESMDYDQQQRHKEEMRFQRQTRQEERAEVLRRRSAEASARMVEEARQEREAMLEEREKQRTRLRSESGSMDAHEPQAPSDDESDEEEESFQLDPATGSWELSRTRTLSRTLACSQKAPLAEAPPVPPEELLACVTEKRTSDYLFARGEWQRYQPSEEDARGFLEGRAARAAPPPGPWRPRLGSLVRWLCTPSPAPGAESDLPPDYLPVFALGGSPAGLGGSSGVAAKVARRLAEDFDLALVEPAAVIEECLAIAQSQEPEEEWPILARMRQLGRGFMTALQDGGQQVMRPSSSPSAPRGPTSPCVPIPHAEFAEMLFRKIELLSAPPPKPVEEEEQPDPKKKKAPPKAKGKKEEEEAPPKRPSGIVISGFPTELASHVAWESALRGYSSPLLRIMDGKEDLQIQLGSILAPWWSLQGSITGEMPEAPLTPCHLEAAEAVQCPMHLLRLSHPDRGALAEALLRQLGEERARLLEAQSPQPPSRGGTAPAGKGPGKQASEESTEPSPAELAKAFACQGFELEQSGMASALDRAWLYEEAQLLVQAFNEPIGCCHDVSAAVAPRPQADAPAPSANGDGESLEDACYHQARELMLRWRGDPAVGQDAEPATAPAAQDAGAAEEDAQGAPAEAQHSGEERPLSRMTSAGALRSASSGGPASGMELWQQMGVQARSRMRHQWLDCMSNYFKGVEAALLEAQSRGFSYRRELVEMQRNFLDFLQRSDDKGTVMTEFIKTWPARVANLKPNTQDIVERLEDVSDRLWQFADQRREEAVQERQRLMEGGFWEDQATSCLRLAERLEALEQRRFQLSLELFSEAHNLQPPMPQGQSHPGDMEGLTSLRQLGAWLRSLTEHLIGDPVEVGKSLEDDAEAVCPDEDLRAALLAEQLALTRRLQAVEAWTNAKLEVMREQLDEVFRRMDDWIRDRVKAENDAIKAAIEEVRNADWSAGLNSPDLMRSTRSLTRSPKGNHRSPSAASTFRRRRREVLATLEARQLDADVYEPQDAEQVPGHSLSTHQLSPLEDSFSGMVSHAGLGRTPAGAAPAAGTDAEAGASGAAEGGGAERPALECRWSQEMLRGLLEGLARRSGGRGAVPEAALLEELLARRNETMSLRSKLVPEGWVARSDDAYRALCRGFAAPGWGAAAADVTEVLLALTFHGRPLSWPSLQALELSRQILETSSSALLETEERVAFPDVPVSEAVFMQLPLWDEEEEAKLQEEANESADDLRKWVFEVLSRFEAAARPPSPAPAALGATASSLAARTASPGFGATASPSRSRAMSPGDVSFSGSLGGPGAAPGARRLLAYLGAAASPTEGLRRALRLLMPTPPAEGMTEEGTLPHEVRVQDLWTVLFSRGARPPAAVAPAPELADFCRELVPPPAPSEPDPAEQKGKAKAKALGKKATTQNDLAEEADAAAAPPPEQAAVALSAQEVERHPAVLRGLCTHGGLMCRRRALAALFSQGSPTPHLVTAAEAAESRGLASLVPVPRAQVAVEEAPEES